MRRIAKKEHIEFVELRRREEGDLSLLLLLLLRDCKNSHLTVKEMNRLGIRYGNPLHTTVDVSELLFEMKVMKRNWRSVRLEQIRLQFNALLLYFFTFAYHKLIDISFQICLGAIKLYDPCWLFSSIGAAKGKRNSDYFPYLCTTVACKRLVNFALFMFHVQ